MPLQSKPENVGADQPSAGTNKKERHASSDAMVCQSTQSYLWYPDSKHELGSGATSHVYRAQHKRKGNRVAAKVFKKDIKPQLQGFVQEEIDLLRTLNHPNVCNFIALESLREPEIGQVLFLEYCELGSVAGMLQQQELRFGLPEADVRTLVNDLAAGISYLWSMNVIHRDIKPANILCAVSEDGSKKFKITDFGGCHKLKDQELKFKTCFGTYEYMHPDMLRAGKQGRKRGEDSAFSYEVDAWSIACSIYQAATGQQPFKVVRGRADCDKLIYMTTNRTKKSIAAVEQDDGTVNYLEQFPKTCLLSTGFRSGLLHMLVDLMDTDNPTYLTPTYLVTKAKQLCQGSPITVIDVLNSKKHTVYLDDKQPITMLMDEIAMVTDITPDNQMLMIGTRSLTDLCPLSTCMSDLQEINNITESSPLYVFPRDTKKCKIHSLSRFDIPDLKEFPEPLTDAGDNYKWGRDCLVDAKHAQRCITMVTDLQRHLGAAWTSISCEARLTKQTVVEKSAVVTDFCHQVAGTTQAITKCTQTIGPQSKFKSIVDSCEKTMLGYEKGDQKIKTLISYCQSLETELIQKNVRGKLRHFHNEAINCCKRTQRCIEGITPIVTQLREERNNRLSHNSVQMHRLNLALIKKHMKQIEEMYRYVCDNLEKALKESRTTFCKTLQLLKYSEKLGESSQYIYREMIKHSKYLIKLQPKLNSMGMAVVVSGHAPAEDTAQAQMGAAPISPRPHLMRSMNTVVSASSSVGSLTSPFDLQSMSDMSTMDSDSGCGGSDSRASSILVVRTFGDNDIYVDPFQVNSCSNGSSQKGSYDATDHTLTGGQSVCSSQYGKRGTSIKCSSSGPDVDVHHDLDLKDARVDMKFYIPDGDLPVQFDIGLGCSKKFATTLSNYLNPQTKQGNKCVGHHRIHSLNLKSNIPRAISLLQDENQPILSSVENLSITLENPMPQPYQIWSVLPHVTRLNIVLSNKESDEENMKRILLEESHEHPKSLCIEGAQSDAAKWHEPLGEYLRSQNVTKELTLQNCCITRTVAKYLTTGLEKRKMKLTLDSCQISPEISEICLQASWKLDFDALEYSNTIITDEMYETFGKLLPYLSLQKLKIQCVSLKMLHDVFKPTINAKSVMNWIEDLTISGQVESKVHRDGVPHRVLSQALSIMPSLQILTISHWNLQPVLENATEAIGKCHQLKNLTLWECSLCDDHLDTISQMLQKSKSLQVLNLGCTFSCSSIRKHMLPVLKNLNLINLKLDVRGALVDMKKLEDDLSECVQALCTVGQLKTPIDCPSMPSLLIHNSPNARPQSDEKDFDSIISQSDVKIIYHGNADEDIHKTNLGYSHDYTTNMASAASSGYDTCSDHPKTNPHPPGLQHMNHQHIKHDQFLQKPHSAYGYNMYNSLQRQSSTGSQDSNLSRSDLCNSNVAEPPSSPMF